MDIADRFVHCLIEHKIKLVCFDFDETITVNTHFISNAFCRVAKKLVQYGILGAVVTFNTDPRLAGKLRKLGIDFPVFSRIIARDVAFGKQWHIRQSLLHYRSEGVLFRNVLLIDDLDNNIKWARRCGCNALEVQGRCGLGSNDLLRCMAQPQFYFPLSAHPSKVPCGFKRSQSQPIPSRRSLEDGRNRLSANEKLPFIFTSLNCLEKNPRVLQVCDCIDDYKNRYLQCIAFRGEQFVPLFLVPC